VDYSVNIISYSGFHHHLCLSLCRKKYLQNKKWGSKPGKFPKFGWFDTEWPCSKRLAAILCCPQRYLMFGQIIRQHSMYPSHRPYTPEKQGKTFCTFQWHRCQRV